MRLKFFKRSAEKFQSRIDPDSEAYRDKRVNSPLLRRMKNNFKVELIPIAKRIGIKGSIPICQDTFLLFLLKYQLMKKSTERTNSGTDIARIQRG